MSVLEVSIRFPNFGIELSDLGKNIKIGNISIAYYGIVIAIGMLCGIAIALHEAKRTGQKTEDYLDLALYAIIFGVIGARLYYVIFRWDYYKDDLLQVFNLRAGGLAIYGGIIAGILTCILYSRIKKKPFFLMADTACLGLLLGQIIGRWGNFFNREAFGGYTDGLFAMQVNLKEAQGGITDEMLEHLVTIDGVDFISVHPTFLYESLWNLAVLLFLLLFLRYHKTFEGEVFCGYLLGYALGRVWMEGLRTDQLQIGNSGIAASQLLSALLVVAVSVIWIVCRVRKAKVGPGLQKDKKV